MNLAAAAAVALFAAAAYATSAGGPAQARSPAPSAAPPSSGSSPAPSPTPSPTPSAAASPTSRPAPVVASAYAFGGKTYAGVTAPLGAVFVAPFAGAVQVRVYQLIDGEIREGSNVLSQPFFPYLTIQSTDRRVIYRPGALTSDVVLLVRDGQAVADRAPLFRTTSAGTSSWRTFYDRDEPYQVIVSLTALPSGADLDALTLFAAR